MAIELTPGFEGPNGTGSWQVRGATEEDLTITGVESTVLRLLILGRKLAPGVHILGLFGMPHEPCRDEPCNGCRK